MLGVAMAIAGLAGTAAPGEPAVLLGPVSRPLRQRALGQEFVLHGAGYLTLGLVFRAYGAALYLADPTDATRVLSADVPRRLEIVYLHATPRSRMIETAEATLARNLTPAELSGVRSAIDRLHAVYDDRRPGDVAALTYVPGVGTEFAVNGERRVLIEGGAFAEAYFGIWLGRRPSSETVKARLLTPYRLAAGP